MHLQFRGNEGQVDADEAEMEPLAEPRFARVPPFRPGPDEASVRAALVCLEKAERPVIVAGGGVRASGAQAELVALAEALQIPVATSLNGKDSIPGNHPLCVGVVGSYSRESANRVVNKADLVCFIGTETGGMTTHFWAVPPIGTPAIQIDINAEALGRNYPLQACVNGDAKVTLARMLEHADRKSAARRKAWVAEVRAICKDWLIKYKPALESDAVPIRPERICHELTQARAGQRHRRGRHRPRRHVDGRLLRSHLAEAELHAQRRPSRLGVLGRARRQMRLPGAAGGDVHRRRRLLVPHRRDRNGGALEDERRDGGEQQLQRQPVEARLRSRLWRQADRAGAGAVAPTPR